MNTNTFPSTPMVAALLLALLGSSSMATPVDDASCRTLAEVTRDFMKARQSGVPLDRLMKLMREPSKHKGSEAVNEWFESYLIAAYKLPRYQTDRMQRQAIEDFGNAAYLKCYGEMKDAQEKDQKTIEPTKTEDTK